MLRLLDARARPLVLTNCGFPEARHFGLVKAMFGLPEDAPTGADGCDIICIGGGEMLRALEESPEGAPVLEALHAELRRAGAAVAAQGRIPLDLRRSLCRPLPERAGLTAEDYDRLANEHWDAELAPRDGH